MTHKYCDQSEDCGHLLSLGIDYFRLRDRKGYIDWNLVLIILIVCVCCLLYVLLQGCVCSPAFHPVKHPAHASSVRADDLFSLNMYAKLCGRNLPGRHNSPQIDTVKEIGQCNEGKLYLRYETRNQKLLQGYTYFPLSSTRVGASLPCVCVCSSH